MSNPDKKAAGKWSQAIIAIESILYSLAIGILLLPVYLGLYALKFFKWLAVVAPAVFIWWIEKTVLPILYIISKGLMVIFKFISIGLLGLLELIYDIYKYLHKWCLGISWCAVRSSIRIIAIICIVGSIYAIIEGVLSLPPNTVIITGRFFDANGTVFRIHEAIALLMISITLFYNAWAYSKDEEVSFICSHTVGVSLLRKIRDKVLK